MNRFVTVAILWATAMPSTAQTKLLMVKDHVSSSVTSNGSFALPTACDEQRHSYVKLVKPGPGMAGPLLRLSSKGVLEAEFDTAGAMVNIYAVRPGGGVAMLHKDAGITLVDNFSPDGKHEAAVRLERPPIAFFPMQIAVFRSGEMLIAGLQYHPGYKASTAIYDATGHLLKQLVLDRDEEIERAIEVGDVRYTRAPREGNQPVSRSVAISGDDGLVYLMRPTSPATIYVISAAAEVVRKIVVRTPTDTGLPDFGLRVAKNRVALEFHRSCDSSFSLSTCRGTVYTVVDATTGERLADYEAAADPGGPIACYAPDPDRFFIFSTQFDKRLLQIVELAPR